MRFLLPFLAATAASQSSTDSNHDGSSFQVQCESFREKIKQPNATVHSVTYVPAGVNISMEYNPAICGGDDPITSTFAFCRIALNVTTSSKSQIFMEAWLPSNYSGRFLSTGNGGLGGCIKYDDMAYAAGYGFATVVEDFAYRALHTGVVVGKELTQSFYPQGYKKSYYLGCSTGGRQGWKSVHRFPDDFDGVVAGAPAFDFVNLTSWGARFLTLTGNSSAATFVTKTQWSTVHEEILRQCDSLDGAVDGVIEDPDLCQPIIETLICNATQASTSGTCLTGAQVETVNGVFSPTYGVDGSLVYPRMQPGSELGASSIYYSGTPFSYAEDWYRYVVYNNTNWDLTTWTIKDAAVASAQDPYQISTWDGDLSPFQNKGGKVLHYHGVEDPVISSDNSKRYYKHVADTMNLSPSELDNFYRFFPISGMGHCANSNGPSSIGQGSGTFSGNKPEDNVLLAMVQWVEEGIAPDFVRGAKLNGSTAEYRRKHCKYPKRNRYVGPGLYTDENAWECV
ncbi:feruloyl esterase B-1 [Aspergillus nomiae NRRL 13137]|uniref:Carboxylic ester hydrolase n=1 Tax=Aspergillus nomiae NRRL (strain ATCC 15546 / NRRL 13137 / CBS 260.88 / M93) TaxID=1509407 RepID=A0A0L1JAW9_ASPN3|nr:feruloyl esterase B-1 [Aspergillus nomiae NRRL 13137]KNG88563.1 feruloyl esterase B-1 [Aspergillus nomiae NRRL 13137]